MKFGKSAGICGITGEIILKGSEIVSDWKWKMCNKAFVESVVPKNFKKAVIVT